MGGTFHPRLNIDGRPIANKYLEGKTKSTLKRESKELEVVEREAIVISKGRVAKWGSRLLFREQTRLEGLAVATLSSPRADLLPDLPLLAGMSYSWYDNRPGVLTESSSPSRGRWGFCTVLG